MIPISQTLRFTQREKRSCAFRKVECSLNHEVRFPLPPVIPSPRTDSRGICQAMTAVLGFALWLGGTAPSVFGQSACPQPAQAAASDPIRTIIPVHLDLSTGDITVGSKTYCGQNPGFHLLALKRQPNLSQLDTPDLVLDQNYTDASSVTSTLQQLLNSDGGPIVIINAVGNYGIALSDISEALAPFGSYPGLEPITTAIPFMFIGNAGRNPQTALQRGYSGLPVDGYLVQDSNNNYTFTQTDFLRYDLNTKDGSITVGQNTYSVADSSRVNCDGQNAFHLLKLDRESPNAPLVNNTYCTAQSDSEIQRLIGDIDLITSNVTDEGSLIFLVSNGHPIPANWNFGTDGDARIYPLAQQIAKLGGYWETMVYLTPSDTYSLVGAAAPAPGTSQPRPRAQESSSVYPDHPTGELHGVLSRGRGDWYSPLNADASGYANLDLYGILAQAPVAFPHPAGADEVAAFEAINQKLCGSATCNVRNQYGNLNINIGTSYLTPLQSTYTKDANGNDCNDSNNTGLPFCAVRAQLINEFTSVSNIRNFYDNVTGLWSSSGTVTLASQLSAYNDVKATLPAPPAAPAPSLAGPIVNLFLNLASRIPEIGPIFGLADVFFNFGTAMTTDPKGNKTVDLTSTIGQLELQASQQFIAQANTTGTLFEFIYQDWGKLSALGGNLASASGQGSPWYWSSTATSQMLQAMQPAVRQAAYQNIMPAAYAIGSYYPDTCCYAGSGIPPWGQYPLSAQPRAYWVEQFYPSGSVPIVHPFAPPDLAIYIPYTYPTDPGNAEYANDPRTGTILADNQWLGISLLTSPSQASPNNENGHYDPPDQSLLSTLFTPVSQGGLGVYRPVFFEGWPFPRVTCDPSFSTRNGPDGPSTTVGGCNWSAARPVTAPVPPGPLVTSLRMQTAQIASNGTEVDVRLTISNNGTASANSIDLRSITLSTLAGSGQATVISPSVPMLINSLAAGDTTDVILKLDIPAGVTKVGITERGLAGFGQRESKFSQGQVLYPQR